ncbi:transporter [Flavobacterium sp. xlx-214]|uniref:transporter n=1 Tax=unclassified Flavobacterium TaxID=196869 RepID=UPI0013D65746|nr:MULTISPECIES: transporter [unclassified Flavobacterium]MBA5791466.1 transporter [Flavobacterium sp. xlx-221]QMI83384.1 transporter [Flavobacterium sp. xlx-214]
MKKYFILAFSFCISYFSQAQYTQEINTNRPSSSMGAYSVSKGIFQLEGGYMYQNDEFNADKINTHNNFNVQARYGEITEQMEFIADLHFTSYNQELNDITTSESGFKQLNFGVKYMIYDHYKYYVEKRNVYSWKANQRFKWKRLIPAVALYAGAQFNTKHNIYYPNLPETSLKAMIIAQQHLSKRFSITYNFIGENVTENEFRNISYIVTASLGLSDRWSIFGEHQGIIDRKYDNITIPFEKEASIKGGLTFKINPNLQIDGFAGTSINNQPHKIQAGMGLSWRNMKKFQFKDPMEL